MNADEKKKTAFEFVLKSEANDRAAIERLISDDFICEIMEVDAAWQLGDKTMGGTMTRDQYLDYGMPAMKQLFKDGMRFTCELAICDGPHVVILGRSEATANNGNKYNNLYSWYFRFSGDTICLIREYRDTHHSRVVIGF